MLGAPGGQPTTSLLNVLGYHYCMDHLGDGLHAMLQWCALARSSFKLDPARRPCQLQHSQSLRHCTVVFASTSA